MTPAKRLVAGLVLLLAACGPANPEKGLISGSSGTLTPEQETFWATLQRHCGKAYAGTVEDATAYYRDSLQGKALIAHFRDCSADRIHIAFHVDTDRSRNWILTRTGNTIRLTHEHRHEDGTEDPMSQYGGDAPKPGLPTRQIFKANDATARLMPLRADNFWFMDFVDANTFEYGVHWPTLGHSVRLAFDLSKPVATPRAPWGY